MHQEVEIINAVMPMNKNGNIEKFSREEVIEVFATEDFVSVGKPTNNGPAKQKYSKANRSRNNRAVSDDIEVNKIKHLLGKVLKKKTDNLNQIVPTDLSFSISQEITSYDQNKTLVNEYGEGKIGIKISNKKNYKLGVRRSKFLLSIYKATRERELARLRTRMFLGSFGLKKDIRIRVVL